MNVWYWGERNRPKIIIKCNQIEVIKISSCSNQFLTHDYLEFLSCLWYLHGTSYLNIAYANKDTTAVKTWGYFIDAALPSGSPSGSAVDSGSALPSVDAAQTATKTKPIVSDNRRKWKVPIVEVSKII